MHILYAGNPMRIHRAIRIVAGGRRPHPRAMRSADRFLLFALGMLWGGSFFFAALALTGLPPLTIVLARVGIAALALNLLLPALGSRMPPRRGKLARFPRHGRAQQPRAVLADPLGQSRIASGLAAILNATTPALRRAPLRIS